MGWAPFRACFSPTHLVTLLRICIKKFVKSFVHWPFQGAAGTDVMIFNKIFDENIGVFWLKLLLVFANN
jgi:hypothetical protein